MRRTARGRRTIALLIACAIVLASILLGIFVVIPRIIASRVEAAARARALSIEWRAIQWSTRSVVLLDARIRPAQGTAFVASTPWLEITLDGLSPKSAEARQLRLELAASPSAVEASVARVRKAEAALPASERIPFSIAGGTLRWARPFGEGSSIEFRGLAGSITPASSRVELRLRQGRVAAEGASIARVTVDVRVTGTETEASLRLPPDPEGSGGGADLEWKGSGGAGELVATFDDLALARIERETAPRGLDLSTAVLKGRITAARDDDGAVRADATLTLSRAKLPALDLGPVAVAIAGDVKTRLRARPRKGAPGVAQVEEGAVEVVVGGRARTARLGGRLSIGEDARGPFEFDLTAEIGPIPCAEIAADLVRGAVPLGLGSGLAASVVRGNVDGKARIVGDLAELDGAKKTIELREACVVELPKKLPLPW